jgi:hypothetical protein
VRRGQKLTGIPTAHKIKLPLWFSASTAAPSFNGRTADSGSAYRGSNPWGAANINAGSIDITYSRLRLCPCYVRIRTALYFRIRRGASEQRKADYTHMARKLAFKRFNLIDAARLLLQATPRELYLQCLFNDLGQRRRNKRLLTVCQTVCNIATPQRLASIGAQS